MVWSKTDIRIDVYDGEDDVVMATVETPIGRLHLSCNVSSEGDRKLAFRRVHVQSDDIAPNEFGLVNLRNLVRAIAEFYDVDELVVAGAKRTSGANPGKIPRVARYARDCRTRPH